MESNNSNETGDLSQHLVDQTIDPTLESQNNDENITPENSDPNIATEELENLWMAKTGLNEETLCGAIETIVYLSEKPIGLQKIRDAIEPTLPLKLVHEAIQKLQTEYEQKHHGIRLQEISEGFQFRTKATYSKFVQDQLSSSAAPLSPATLEVLAIVCYKQPISKTQIEVIRGVDSSHLVRTLLDKRLITISGRSETEPGKPTLYTTTTEFLEFFNLNSLEDLPSFPELQELAEIQTTKSLPSIQEVMMKNGEQRFNFDDLLELDEISAKVKEIKVDTEFTKLMKEAKENQQKRGDFFAADSEVQNSALEAGSPPEMKPVLTSFELLAQFTDSLPVAKQEIPPNKNEELLLETEKNIEPTQDKLEHNELKLGAELSDELGELLNSAFDKLINRSDEDEEDRNDKN